MGLNEYSSGIEQRFGQQLFRLSELTEMLTLRLLELEERLLKLEEVSNSPIDAKQEDTVHLLQESELRVKHLQSLLSPDGLEQKGVQDVSSGKESLNDFAQEGNISSSQEDASFELFEQEDSGIESQMNNPLDGEVSNETEYVDDPQMPLLSA